MRLWCDSSVINCDFDWMKLSSFQKKEVQQKRICDTLLTGGFGLGGGGARSKRDRKPKSPPPSIISYSLVKLDQMTITVSAFSSPGGTEGGAWGGGGVTLHPHQSTTKRGAKKAAE